MNSETGGALAQFFFGGRGPSHAKISGAIRLAGLGSFDDYKYEPGKQGPNKQQRVIEICRVAEKQPDNAKKLVDALLNALRLDGAFRDDDNTDEITNLRSAFAHLGWSLTEEGRLDRVGSIDLETGGRAALDEQVARLRRNIGDPAAALGFAKELLEAVSKFVLEEAQRPPNPKLPFTGLVQQTFEVLGFERPVPSSVSGASHVRYLYSNARKVAICVNEIRNDAGTGHGRTLPTGISEEVARFVASQAVLISELMLSTHDRQMGRA